MKKFVLSATLFCGAMLTLPAWGATTRVPLCLNYPDSNTQVPCTGVIPVDASGNPLNWASLLSGQGGGGTGGGSSNAAASTVGQTAGTAASQTGYVGSDGKLYNWAGDVLGHPAVSIFGTPTVTATQAGSWNITNITGTISLPTGAARSANQSTELTSLSQIVTAVTGATPTGTNTIGNVGGTQTSGSAVAGGGFRAMMSAAGNAADLVGTAAGGLFVQGAVAAGVAIAGNPISVGFSDGTLSQRAKGDNVTGAIFTEEKLRSQYWQDTLVALGVSATFTSTSRDAGGTIAGVGTPWSSYRCSARSDQVGTLTMSMSNDNAIWIPVQSVSLVANTMVVLTSPIMTRYWRCAVVNGTTAETSLNVNSAFGL